MRVLYISSVAHPCVTLPHHFYKTSLQTGELPGYFKAPPLKPYPFSVFKFGLCVTVWLCF